MCEFHKYAFVWVQVPTLPRQSSTASTESGKLKKEAPVEVDDTAMFERKKPTSAESLLQTKKVIFPTVKLSARPSFVFHF